MASTQSGHNCKIIGKTRLLAPSVSQKKRFDPVIQEEQQFANQQMTQELTMVSLCICTCI